MFKKLKSNSYAIFLSPSKRGIIREVMYEDYQAYGWKKGTYTEMVAEGVHKYSSLLIVLEE